MTYNDQPQDSSLARVVLAASAGTVIEWYDFFLYGSLAVFFSGLFFPKSSPESALLISVATFATGFAARPFGAALFGRMGDSIGRKYTFLVTLTLMGISTTLIGVLPTFQQWGWAAPIALVTLRLLSGLAVGGEYGGAATYIAEFAPSHRRGHFTSFLQATASIGLLAALGVILVCRLTLGEVAFHQWGWRIPFLLSAVLVVLSVYIRLRLDESPVFLALKQRAMLSRSPFKESFGTKDGLRRSAIALFGSTSGQAVTFYTAHFYALYFMQSILKINFVTTSLCMMVAVTVGAPLFVFFGGLSDRVGRRKLILGGLIGAAICYLPAYMVLRAAASPPQPGLITLALIAQIFFAAMAYGPLAAYLTELFPARVRVTSLAIPYNIGNGIFGGFMPLIGLSLVAATGNIYAGLAYPILVTLLNVVVNLTLARPGDLVQDG